MKPLEFHYDLGTDVLTVEGIKYSGGLFRFIAFGPIGAVLLIDRKDGVVMFTRLYDHETWTEPLRSE